jgi:hypothetical protein
VPVNEFTITLAIGGAPPDAADDASEQPRRAAPTASSRDRERDGEDDMGTFSRKGRAG